MKWFQLHVVWVIWSLECHSFSLSGWLFSLIYATRQQGTICSRLNRLELFYCAVIFKINCGMKGALNRCITIFAYSFRMLISSVYISFSIPRPTVLHTAHRLSCVIHLHHKANNSLCSSVLPLYVAKYIMICGLSDRSLSISRTHATYPCR